MMNDADLVDELAAVVWGLNLDRDAHSIARDLAPLVRRLAPHLVADTDPLALAPAVHGLRSIGWPQ